MISRNRQVGLIVTLLLLVAVGTAIAPPAGAVALKQVEVSDCSTSGSGGWNQATCTFDCIPGMMVHVELTGSGNIKAKCGNSTQAECDGGSDESCDGQRRYTGSSTRGRCEITGEGEGTCWVGEHLPHIKA